MAKLTIRYSDAGMAFGDRQSMPFAKQCINSFLNDQKDQEVCVSNEMTILAFRVLVRNKRIDHQNIIIKINNEDKEYYLDKDGRWTSYPDNFNSEFDNFLDDLLSPPPKEYGTK